MHTTLTPVLRFAAGFSLCFALAQTATAAADDLAPVKNGVSQVQITLKKGDSGNACVLDHTSAKAGPVTFKVTNRNATAISELELLLDNRILAEKENLAPGLPTVSFTKNLSGGAYSIYCPGAKEDMVTFKVIGTAAPRATGSTAELLAEGAKGYKDYVDSNVDAMVVAVTRLKKAIDNEDLAASQALYPLARPFYEKIESYVDLFVLPGFAATDNHGNLDYLIDMRASNLDPEVGWHGFHAIERDLFGKGEISSTTKALAAELHRNVSQLDDLVKELTYRPEDLANGAADLLEEVQSTKITGEEEAFSHYDLIDFVKNVEGAEQAFVHLRPGLEKIDPDLSERVSAEFAKVKAMMKEYRDPEIPGGYKRYTAELKASDGGKLAKRIHALQEPLTRIAEKIAMAQ